MPALERLPADARLAATIFVERYGLDGEPPRSLEDVSERHGISRLDVRLIESRVLRAMRDGAGRGDARQQPWRS